MLSPLETTYNQFAHALKQGYGKGDYHAKAIYQAVIRSGLTDFTALEELAKSGEFGTAITKDLAFTPPAITPSESGSVTKFATTLHDDTIIESVIIPGPKRVTLCVSSQVGCKMACSFCATGDMGFTRNLTTFEIIHQLWSAIFEFHAQITNIVFMGMGEPLDNLDAVLQAVAIMTDHKGFGLAPRRISISTSGLVPAIERIGKEAPKTRLAISLNGSNNTLRDEVMPINKRYPLEQLKAVLLGFPLDKNTKFLIEYVLLKGVNDATCNMKEIIEFCQGLPVIVNLIPYNGTKYSTPTTAEVHACMDTLIAAGLFVQERSSQGGEIEAACGQLSKKLSGDTREK